MNIIIYLRVILWPELIAAARRLTCFCGADCGGGSVLKASLTFCSIWGHWDRVRGCVVTRLKFISIYYYYFWNKVNFGFTSVSRTLVATLWSASWACLPQGSSWKSSRFPCQNIQKNLELRFRFSHDGRFSRLCQTGGFFLRFLMLFGDKPWDLVTWKWPAVTNGMTMIVDCLQK